MSLLEKPSPIDATEGQHLDRKSLRKVAGNTANFAELAQDCVAFANGSGGQILIGIEDKETRPTPDQRINPAVLDGIRKRVGELTVNVQALPELRRDENGGEYIVLTVPRSEEHPARKPTSKRWACPHIPRPKIDGA